jgi:hypothetical protein
LEKPAKNLKLFESSLKTPASFKESLKTLVSFKNFNKSPKPAKKFQISLQTLKQIPIHFDSDFSDKNLYQPIKPVAPGFPPKSAIQYLSAQDLLIPIAPTLDNCLWEGIRNRSS